MESTREAHTPLTLSVVFGTAAAVFGFLKAFNMPHQTRALVCALSVMSLSFCFFTLLCQHLIESAEGEGSEGEPLRQRLHHIAGLIGRCATLYGIFFIGVSLYLFLDWERMPIGLFWRHSSMLALVCGVGQLITLSVARARLKR